MDIETAKKINKTLVDYYLHEITHKDVPSGPPPDYSLEDMLEATRMMEGHRERGTTAGSGLSLMTCAKRLLAAIYVLKNYHTTELDDLTDVIIAGGGKALVCLQIRDLVCLSRLYEKRDRDDDCFTCGKVDIEELPESKAAELLRRSIGLMAAMTGVLDLDVMSEKMEDFLEEVAGVFPKFAWRKAGSNYSVTADPEAFQPTANDW